MVWHLPGSRGGAQRFAEFLPDTEGVIERGHSPAAPLLIVAVSAAFAGLLAWAALTEVEQVVQAPGQVEPVGRVKLVNHPDGGRIAEVHVVEGARVRAGDPLVTFDPELVRTQLAELAGRLEVKNAEIARLQAEVAGGALEIAPELAAARPVLVEEQRQLLESRRAAYESRAEALTQTVARRGSEIASINADLVRLRNGQELIGEQLEAVRGLAEKGLYPRLRLVAVERQLSDLSGDIDGARARREAAEAALAEAKSLRDGLGRDWRSTLLAELSAATEERDRLVESHKRQAATLRNLVVRAPVDGIVQELAVTSAGQSVGSNQPLLKLVPTEGGLVIEARVDNQDIGYVRLAQPVKVKIQAYDFLRYGTLGGTVERIAADAVVDPQDGKLGYGITVRTDDAALGDGALRVSVVPGMAVEVELLVGGRTILSYLTDRIFRLQDAAFREG
jgi:HlyD family type I secretion membrane fusion protein